MKRHRIKLKFKTPIHLGYKEGIYNITETIVHSDTLFSGITNCYALLFGKEKTQEFLTKVFEGKFFVSSAFYYIGDEFLFPKPLVNNCYMDYKKNKRIKYVSEKILKKESDQGYILQNALLSKEVRGFIYKIEERPRVTVDRWTSESNIYYTACCRFSENSGLWFYMDVDEEIVDDVFAALRLLGDEGLGGMRTYGYGSFELESWEEDIENLKEVNLLLSLFLPKDDEWKKFVGYQIVERTGYIFSPYERTKKHKVYRMFEEGSVVQGVVQGDIFDDTPKGFEVHKTFKYGRAFLVPYA